jgi:hypothetical protein
VYGTYGFNGFNSRGYRTHLVTFDVQTICFAVFRHDRKIAKKKTSISFVVSLRPSVLPHGETRHKLEGFFVKFYV